MSDIFHTQCVQFFFAKMSHLVNGRCSRWRSEITLMCSTLSRAVVFLHASLIPGVPFYSTCGLSGVGSSPGSLCPTGSAHATQMQLKLEPAAWCQHRRVFEDSCWRGNGNLDLLYEQTLFHSHFNQGLKQAHYRKWNTVKLLDPWARLILNEHEPSFTVHIYF